MDIKDMFLEKDLDKIKFTAPFGYAQWRADMGIPPNHRGIDLGMPIGTAIYAPFDCKIIYSKLNNGGEKKGYGYYVVAQKRDTDEYILLGHLRGLYGRKVGQRLEKGDLLGCSGNTGVTTGPHLHLEYHKGGFHFGYQVRNGLEETAVNPIVVIDDVHMEVGKKISDMNPIRTMTAREFLQDKTGLSDYTMQYLDSYKYSDDLIDKLVNAIMKKK